MMLLQACEPSGTVNRVGPARPGAWIRYGGVAGTEWGIGHRSLPVCSTRATAASEWPLLVRIVLNKKDAAREPAVPSESLTSRSWLESSE
jgi:hypothetical protein